MNQLQNSKTAMKVTEFFGKSMMDPEINLGEFMEAVAVSLGSTIALRIKEDGHEEILAETAKRIRAGCDAGRSVKPAADLLRGLRGGAGIHIVIIEGGKK